MSETLSDKKRLIRITVGNLRQNHLYVHGLYDFFPAEAFAKSIS